MPKIVLRYPKHVHLIQIYLVDLAAISFPALIEGTHLGDVQMVVIFATSLILFLITFMWMYQLSDASRLMRLMDATSPTLHLVCVSWRILLIPGLSAVAYLCSQQPSRFMCLATMSLYCAYGLGVALETLSLFLLWRHGRFQNI